MKDKDKKIWTLRFYYKDGTSFINHTTGGVVLHYTYEVAESQVECYSGRSFEGMYDKIIIEKGWVGQRYPVPAEADFLDMMKEIDKKISPLAYSKAQRIMEKNGWGKGLTPPPNWNKNICKECQ